MLDGHGGQDCAQFVSEELPSALVESLRNSTTSSSSSSSSSSSHAAALYCSFLRVDSEFAHTLGKRSHAGSTANVLLHHSKEGMCYIANLGDTRTVIGRSSGTGATEKDRYIGVDLTVDQKATTPAEIARISACGGFVANGRVLGSLAVARAFGDCQLKTEQTATTPTGSSYLQPATAVSAAPEITHYCPLNRSVVVINHSSS